MKQFTIKCRHQQCTLGKVYEKLDNKEKFGDTPRWENVLQAEINEQHGNPKSGLTLNINRYNHYQMQASRS